MNDLPELIRRHALPLNAMEQDAERLAERFGDASLVLLGEATHGTHEFYAWRAAITRALIERRGFTAVAIEGDWPDAYQVNRYVQGGAALDASDALKGFERFPTWMWRNTAFAEFVAWLRERNLGTVAHDRRAGIYGLDLYSLHASMQAVIDYLERHDPENAAKARASYRCFEQFGHDLDLYAWAASGPDNVGCADAVAAQLAALRESRQAVLQRDGSGAHDEFFYAEQNARLAQNAELYYRTMLRGHIASWNVRDQHMAETVEALREHLLHRGLAAKIVVWAHNSHIGDARATEMGRRGELNLGQLVRERHGPAAALIGFTTFQGSVIAANDWGDTGRRKTVRPALSGSCEAQLHASGLPAFFLPLGAGERLHDAWRQSRLERAIGVIYRPDTERVSHYFEAKLAEQFDAVVHLDETRAVQPLEPVVAWDHEEVPETFPSGV